MNPANPAAGGAPAAGAPGQQQQQQRPNIMKMVLTYMAINWVINNVFKSNTPGANQRGPLAFKNVFEDNEPYEFRMYINDQNDTILDTDVPVWEETDLKYNYDKENHRDKVLEFNIDELIKDTPTPKLYAHLTVSSTRSELTDNYTDYFPHLTQTVTFELIEYRKKKNEKLHENLLFSEEDDKVKNTTKTEEEKIETNTTEEEKLPHLRTKIYIQFVHDTDPHMREEFNQAGAGPLGAFVDLKAMAPQFLNTTLDNPIYIPILDVSQFWLREKDYILLDAHAENKTVNTTFMFYPYWSKKFMMERQLQQSGKIYENLGVSTGGSDHSEELKEMIMDANPILLGVTFLVQMLHSVFEFLALKNDIAFWKNVESHKGLSLRSLWVNLITEIVVILYLFDNETSYIILVGAVAGLAVTIWKIFKTTNFKKRQDGKFPYVEIDYQQSYKETTQEHDQAASKYLIWLLIPLFIGYAVYSLVYEKHKGWYSYVVQTLVGFIYVFGFIEMTPQLYINYKLKSVEHLPWRVMVYKFLNTIVDDFAVFLITMPWLKRLSCFRDDIIFVIYLYQRWIYRVDKNRDPYGNIIKKEETAAPSEGQRRPQAVEAAAPGAESEGVTQRNVQQGNKQNASPQKAAASDSGKMKKKKVA